jgi:hypothetical protein
MRVFFASIRSCSHVFVQGHLCRAAIADPRLPRRAKEALMAFHGLTVHENIADR